MLDDRPRRGSALVDVLLAVVLLAIGGTALVTVVGQTSRSMRTMLETESLADSASRQLEWLAIASRADLTARIGRTHLRGWTIDVRNESPSLFDVSIARSDTTGELLRTTLYRPDSATGTP